MLDIAKVFPCSDFNFAEHDGRQKDIFPPPPLPHYNDDIDNGIPLPSLNSHESEGINLR